jgi:hypothetical protein
MEERRTSYFGERKQSLMITLNWCRLDWRQPCPNRFRSKQSQKKRASVLRQSIKLSFYKTTTIPWQRKPYLYCHRFWKKHSNSIWQMHCMTIRSNQWLLKEATNITNFHWCKFVGWSTCFRGTIHSRRHCSPTLSADFLENTIGQDELIISRNHD